MKKFLAMMLAILAAGFVLASSNASAGGTPDAAVPANEGVCDDLQAEGVTKGLYGLCVAYCEAQDMDEYPSKNPEQIVEKVPNSKILRNYNRKKTDADPSMPCLSTPCPCFDSDVMSEFGNHGLGNPELLCQIDSVNSVGTVQTFINEYETDGNGVLLDDFFATVFKYGEEHTNYPGQTFCAYVDYDDSVNISASIDAVEYAGCRTLIVEQCTELGLPVSP